MIMMMAVLKAMIMMSLVIMLVAIMVTGSKIMFIVVNCCGHGYACPQSSRLAEPLWTDRGLESETGTFKIISTGKKNTGEK